MEIAGFIRSIHDDPDDEALRLVFADWLEEHAQGERAAWIRLSCEFAHVRYADPRWKPLLQRLNDSWRRCQPEWWEQISSVYQRNDCGIYCFVTGESRSTRGPTPVKRLGKISWLGKALEEGWLLRIEHKGYHEELTGIIAKWKEPASRVPLFVQPVPQIGDQGLRDLLAFPQLEGLDLVTHALRNPVIKELSSYRQIRDLQVELRLVEDATVDAVIGQLVAMPGLQRLRLKSDDDIRYGNRPNDGDLMKLASQQSLKRLVLESCAAVSEAGIEQLKKSLPSCIITRV